MDSAHEVFDTIPEVITEIISGGVPRIITKEIFGGISEDVLGRLLEGVLVEFQKELLKASAKNPALNSWRSRGRNPEVILEISREKLPKIP